MTEGMIGWLNVASLGSAFATSILVVWTVLLVSTRFNLVSEPNERSFHVIPTPTMGGLGLWLPGFFASLYFAYQGHPLFVPLSIATLLVGGVSLWDDFKSLSGGIRLVVQAIAVALVLWGLKQVYNDHWLLSVAGMLVIGVGLIWFINLYNFMDGIDGLAAAQCIVFCVGCVLLKAGPAASLDVLLWVLIGSALGFLAFNWAPARIFMGDVGSGYLGLILGTVAVSIWLQGLLALVPILILLAVFWFDASCTLGVRMLTKQRFMEAHRSHLYQKVAERLGHQGTTVTFVIYFVLWLLPNATSAQLFPRLQLFFLGLACLPLAVACYIFRAGLPDTGAPRKVSCEQ